MKKGFKTLALSLLTGLIFCSTAFATGSVVTKEVQLRIGGVNVDSYVMTSTVNENTDAIPVNNNQGFGAILVTVDSSGDLDISIEYSLDGINFYTGYDVSDPMDGILVIDGDIAETVANGSRYITFPIRLANFVRFNLKPDANSTVSASFLYLK